MELRKPYYDEDSSLNLIKVETKHGIEYRTNCKLIDGLYLVKGKDLDWDGDNWVKVGTAKKKVIDHRTGKSVTNLAKLKKGIVALDKDGKEVMGYFSEDLYTECKVYTPNPPYGGESVDCMDVAILDEAFYIEDISKGYYLRRDKLTAEGIRTATRKRVATNNDGQPYNILDSYDSLQASIKLYNKSKLPIDKDLQFISSYIKDVTFGVELETCNGTLPQHILNTYGVIICKDGSLRDDNGNYPPEYVTIPLKGAKGLQVLRNISREIAKRSDISMKCSYHVHLGGYKIDRVLMTSLFKLCTKIQDDVFQMFPLYKTDEVRYANKEKNYCQKLPNILSSYISGDFKSYVNDTYEDVYSFLTGGKKFTPSTNVRARSNPWGQGKWNTPTRYYWVNFVNPVFGKQDTIEFRLHTPTLNPDKIINWLLMCVAIMSYAEKEPLKCMSVAPITFENVLDYYKTVRNTSLASMLSNNLIDYYKERVAFYKAKTKAGDYLCSGDIALDASYEFKVLNLKK